MQHVVSNKQQFVRRLQPVQASNNIESKAPYYWPFVTNVYPLQRDSHTRSVYRAWGLRKTKGPNGFMRGPYIPI